jgi:predicted nucleotidyltransferase
LHSAQHILQAIEANNAVLKHLGVRELALFGSCARGEGTETSDLDFLVTFEKASFDAYMDLKAFLEQLFVRRVDLVTKAALKPRLGERILKEAVRAAGL